MSIFCYNVEVGPKGKIRDLAKYTKLYLKVIMTFFNSIVKIRANLIVRYLKEQFQRSQKQDPVAKRPGSTGRGAPIHVNMPNE